MLHMKHWEGKILKPFCMVHTQCIRFSTYSVLRKLPAKFFSTMFHAENGRKPHGHCAHDPTFSFEQGRSKSRFKEEMKTLCVS
jgi:hypothetical protein